MYLFHRFFQSAEQIELPQRRIVRAKAACVVSAA